MAMPILPGHPVSRTVGFILLALLAMTAEGAGGVPATAGGVLRICPAPGAGCDATSLPEGLGRAATGSLVTIAPGTYREAGIVAADGVTLRADPGARLVGVAAEGKAALVIRGDDTVIEGLECSEIAVPDGNGACIRLEGRNLTVRHVHFHDAEEGILIADTGGTVIIEDSRFERLGASGRAHGVYANHIEALIIRRSCFLSSTDQGHEVKSRAARTVIEDSLIASFNGVDSRLIDLPNGGDLVVRDSILVKGPRSSSRDVIGFGLEGIGHPVNGVRLENTVIIIDHPRARLINGEVPTILSGVQMIGGDPREAGAAPWPSHGGEVVSLAECLRDTGSPRSAGLGRGGRVIPEHGQQADGPAGERSAVIDHGPVDNEANGKIAKSIVNPVHDEALR